MVRLHLLGTVELRDTAGKELRSIIAQPKRLALLAYLAVASPCGFHRRDHLLALFWPESDADHARNSLRQALHFLRHALGGAIVIGRGEEEVGIAPDAMWCDVVEFEAAIARKDHPRAAALYRGALLPGFFVPEAPGFDRWLEDQRQRLAEACASALETVADEAMARGDFTVAVEYLRRRVAFAPLNSRVALRLMTALAAGGEREAAIDHAEQHGALLREELDAPNDPSIAKLAEHLRRAPAPEDRARSEKPALAAAGSPITADVEPANALPDAPSTRAEAAVMARRRARHALAMGVGATLGVTATVLALAPALRTSPPAAPLGVVMAAVDRADGASEQATERALRDALRSAHGIFLLDDSIAAETRARMRIRPEAPLTVPVAAHLAIRRGLPYVATISVIRVDEGTRVTLQLIDALTSTTVGTASGTVASGGSLTGTAVALADSLAAHASRRPPPDSALYPLPDVTTGSLEALRAYARARRIRIPDAESAMRFAEAAIGEDSSFAMAHYFVGELSWFSDQQTKSDYHFTRAFELSGGLPPRERLLIASRYFYIVLDRPDSARIYATRLLGTAPSDALAYEGVAWMYRAFGWHEYAGAMADTALMLDSSSYGAISTRGASYIDRGDTVGAMAWARRIASRHPPAEDGVRGAAALLRGDWKGQLRTLDSLHPRTAPGQNSYTLGVAPNRHLILIGMGRVAEAAAILPDMRVGSVTQYLPRALLLQARAEVDGGSPDVARALVTEAMQWIGSNDLSPPAVARLIERGADVLARAKDAEGIEALEQLARHHDRGRGSHSLSLARATLTGARAYARGDMKGASDGLQRARQYTGYLGRPLATLALLEADARAAAGDREGATLLYREVASLTMAHGDLATWAALMRPRAERALQTVPR